MKRAGVVLIGMCLAAGSARAADQGPGTLVIIGGGMNTAATKIYQAFIQRGGGADRIRIAIIPAASSEPASSGREQAREFVQAGVAAERVRVFPVAIVDDPTTPEVNESTWARNAFDPKLAGEMAGYNAVFFSGGDQVRHVQSLRNRDGTDSPLLAAIRRIFAEGGVVGGTSAGAAVMSDPMICNGDSLNAVIEGAGQQPWGCDESRGVSLTMGLGFFRHGLADQHFLKRGRIGRLIVALQHLKSTAPGVGIDEDTAAVCRGSEMEVVGSSGVLLVDCRRAAVSRTAAGLRAEDIRLDYLAEGDRYDFATGVATPAPWRKPIERGREEYARSPTATNTFGRDVVKDLLTSGLADCRQEQAHAIAFRLEGDQPNRGSAWRFSKTSGTRSFWGHDAMGDGGYTVLGVRLDIEPVTVSVAPAQ